jgi:phosphatidylglycerol:prolipoprotein diacylglycerol transferase
MASDRRAKTFPFAPPALTFPAVHPIAFHIGTYAVRWYGIMVALAFLAGLYTAARRGRRSGFTSDQILDLGPWLLIGGIVGARIFYVFEYWRESFAGGLWWEVFMIQHGGLVFYGGFIGASLAGILYAWRSRLPLWRLADVIAPSIALGSVLGRIGCLLNGCCYGRVCTEPWAIHFPAGHETYPEGVHPTEIYDALLNLVLYLALAALFRRKKFDGQVFAGYLLAYAVIRSIVESFRGDYPPGNIHFGLTPAQLMGIGIFATGAILYAMRARAQKRA